MQIVTLTTDWGYGDYYMGVVKGRLYSTIADVQVVDITHNIRKYDNLSAAFVVKNACFEFPEGTIHIIDVNSYEETKDDDKRERNFVAIKHKGQYYICTDDGLPSIVFGNDEVEIVRISLFNETNYYTFAALDLFAKVAKHISEAGTIEHLGVKQEGFVNQLILPKPLIYEDRIIVTVIHVDSYGNAFLNITDKEFKAARGRKNFFIQIDKVCNVTKLSQSYADLDKKLDNAVLTISSSGYLELALKGESISRLRNIQVGDTFVIEIRN